MMTTWSSSAAQPIHGWQQGSHFASSPYSSGFLHGGMQRPRQSPYYSESLRSSYQSAQAQETLQFQDELNELMMGNPEGCEPQSSVSPDTTHPSYRWSGEGQCDNAFSPSFDDSIMASSSEYGMSSFSSCTHSTATSPQEPATPAAHQWETQQTGPHIRRDSVNMTVNGLLRPYSQYDSFNMSLQQSDTIQECEDQKVNPAHMPDLVDPCQFVPSSKLAPSVFTPAWSINPDFGLPDSIGDMSSSHDADPFFHRVRWLPEGARPQSSVRAEQDRLIIEGKRRNMSYKEIKEHYKIEGAVSTLRGRYRAAVKPKSQRVRKPEWKPKDLELLAFFVNQRLGQGKVRKLKNLHSVDYLYIPWKSVVQDIADNGGSYHFGPSAAKKRFVKLVTADKAREEAMDKANSTASASSEMSTNTSTESILTEKQSTQYPTSPYELRSQTAQQMTSPSDSRTILQMNPYALAYDHRSYRPTYQASLPMSSHHRLPTL